MQYLSIFLVFVVGCAYCVQTEQGDNHNEEAINKLMARLSLLSDNSMYKRALPRMGRSFTFDEEAESDENDSSNDDDDLVVNTYLKRALPRMGRALPRMGRALPRMGRALPRMGRALPRMG